MNSSQPTDQPGNSAIQSDPIVLDEEALKQVAGGETGIASNPEWVTVPGGPVL